jgi:hypothetical protein
MMLPLLSITKWFFCIQILVIHDNILVQNVKMLNIPLFVSINKMDLFQISIIHDNTYDLIHKKCYKKATTMT